MPELPNIDELAITASRQFESSRAQNDSLAVNEFVRDSGLLDQLPPEQHQSLLAIRLKVHADLKRKLGARSTPTTGTKANRRQPMRR